MTNQTFRSLHRTLRDAERTAGVYRPCVLGIDLRVRFRR